MATIYQDTPPQFFKPTIPNNSSSVKGYYVTVNESNGETTIFRKSTNLLGQEQIESIGSIPKAGGGGFANTGRASKEEIQYFTANARKTVTDQAVPVVRRGIGGQAGGGDAKVNSILGTQLSTQQTNPDEPDLSKPPVTAPLTSTNEDINELTKSIKNDPRESIVKKRLSAINARYPEDISTKQDTILFRLKEIIGRDFDPLTTKARDANFTFGTKSLSQPFGSVVLPIQPSISDSNGVDWGNPTLDPLSAFAGRASLAMQTSDQIIQEVGNQFKLAAGLFKENYQSYASALNLYLAQEAIGAQGLFSRGTGAVLNPNLELLFTGPSLRPFNFTFRLSPRSEKEAKEVKKIIYFFKAGMATRRANTAVFLKAPYVFSIQYQTGTSEGLDSHKSLNRIKDCALLSCDVDYTPDGTYMTFNDEEKTITSYQLTLRFSELDPVYNTDYVDSHPIGY